jgi:hypothetical protein
MEKPAISGSKIPSYIATAYLGRPTLYFSLAYKVPSPRDFVAIKLAFRRLLPEALLPVITINLKNIQKEVFVAYFKVLSLQLRGSIKEMHEKPQLR